MITDIYCDLLMPDEDKNPHGPLVMDFRIVFYHKNFCNLAVVEILIVCLLAF